MDFGGNPNLQISFIIYSRIDFLRSEMINVSPSMAEICERKWYVEWLNWRNSEVVTWTIIYIQMAEMLLPNLKPKNISNLHIIIIEQNMLMNDFHYYWMECRNLDSP